MTHLSVLILVCASAIPKADCTVDNARLAIAARAPEGIIVCGPTLAMAEQATGPSSEEYVKVKCSLEK